MPKYSGIHRKVYPSGKMVYYGSKWYQGKAYNTSIFTTAKEASDALRELIRQLKRNVTPDKGKITVKQFIKLYMDKYIVPRNIDNVTKYKIESSLRNQIIPFIGDF